MRRYAINRTLQAIVTVYAVITISFVIVRFMPSSPADRLRGQIIQENPSLSSAEVNRRVQNYINVDLSEPLHEQYVNYVLELHQGDFGQSITHSEPVADILAGALPWTIFAFSIGIGLMFTIGIALGALMAYAEGSRFDVSTTGVGVVLNSTPNYIVGILLLYVFGYTLGWFPTGGRSSVDATLALGDPAATLSFVVDAFHHAALMIAAIVTTGFGGVALGMRGNSIQVLGEEYVRVARLRGLPKRRIAFRYVGRNAILPMYTALLLAVGGVIGGSAILEQVFTYPGVGYYLVDAVQMRDYPLMMGGFLVITLAVVVGAFVADVTYGLLDPRASVDGGDGG